LCRYPEFNNSFRMCCACVNEGAYPWRKNNCDSRGSVPCFGREDECEAVDRVRAGVGHVGFREEHDVPVPESHFFHNLLLERNLTDVLDIPVNYRKLRSIWELTYTILKRVGGLRAGGGYLRYIPEKSCSVDSGSWMWALGMGWGGWWQNMYG
jgi:hypothetical protein